MAKVTYDTAGSNSKFVEAAGQIRRVSQEAASHVLSMIAAGSSDASINSYIDALPVDVPGPKGSVAPRVAEQALKQH